MNKTYPLYKFACGCIGSHPGQDINLCLKPCPVHGEKAIRKIFKCEICGRETETSIRTTSLKACPECKSEAHKRYNRVYYHQVQKHNRKPRIKQTTPISGKDAPKRRYDCKYYDECMQINGRLMRNSRACLNCNEYEHKDLNVLEYTFYE